MKLTLDVEVKMNDIILLKSLLKLTDTLLVTCHQQTPNQYNVGPFSWICVKYVQIKVLFILF